MLKTVILIMMTILMFKIITPTMMISLILNISIFQKRGLTIETNTGILNVVYHISYYFKNGKQKNSNRKSIKNVIGFIYTTIIKYTVAIQIV